MGSSESKTHPREPPVSWRVAIGRRLQIWEGLKPFLIQVITAVGLGKYDMTRDRKWKSKRLITNVSRRRNDSHPRTPHARAARSSVINERRKQSGDRSGDDAC